ncbi:hypothetical protein TBLA_0I00420 [Henningerozyma blattae CBS 6284]|uniref:Diphthamide biosynthesis protein 3 n=1 Tax=Henningerozyma blattae (strain ATCC 34711 / CBS 6284 / DSM 70876 / NBRC 10599 / NRRL Y-10934 / UCD 77-7) TaxID=1071380 RepID=I2H8K3_HENB6|nr:hypothetical protein TBLA_0I00420 [Tetrapisispora blattae CBS 6284]CCH62705.1 hypothetical protein TBLA_0I00420 [Tetrapisispora blattae CBS 6284]
MASAAYDQIEIEDMVFHPETQLFTYPCPCGDRFEVFIDDLFDGETRAVCPSCSLEIDVIFEQEDLAEYYEEAGVQPPEPLAIAT